jgi:hypothetical protein
MAAPWVCPKPPPALNATPARLRAPWRRMRGSHATEPERLTGLGTRRIHVDKGYRGHCSGPKFFWEWLMPNWNFDPAAYLVANPELSDYVNRPLFHYLKIGKQGGMG